MTTPDVLCIGHASHDMTLSVAYHPGPDEKVHADYFNSSGGGPAANAAIAVSRLGGLSAFCGYLGYDDYGEAHAREFLTEGVDMSFTVRGSHPTPISAVLAKSDGLRSVVNFKKETPCLELESLEGLSLSAIDARVLLFDGHEPKISKQILEAARSRGIPTVLDAGSVNQGSHLLAPHVDYLVGSERFAQDWAGTDDVRVALKVLNGVAPNIVITLGAKGLIWARGGHRGHVPAFQVNAIDSTGAGDAFHGAFAFGLARGMGWEELLRYASAVGALTCMKLGARAGIPDAKSVRVFLDSR